MFPPLDILHEPDFYFKWWGLFFYFLRRNCRKGGFVTPEKKQNLKKNNFIGIFGVQKEFF
jgi:hypothetical protein